MKTYRITYTAENDTTSVVDSIGSGTTDHEEIYDDIDQGYDRFQWLRKQWWASNVTWEGVED